MSSHPGSTLRDAATLAAYLKKNKCRPEQVQDFYPTPGTASTVMYYTGINPLTGKPVYVAREPHEKALQRALLQWSRPQNADLVREALIRADRRDLIGTGEKCLIGPKFDPAKNRGRPPRPNTRSNTRSHSRSNPKKGGKRRP
jgi:radical SAM superfamily enzyme YgiQ (UPF0313 family)